MLKTGQRNAGEKKGEGADPKLMHNEQWPIRKSRASEFALPSERRPAAAWLVMWKSLAQRSQKNLNHLPMVDTEKGRGRCAADRGGAGGRGFPSFVLASCKASLGFEKTMATLKHQLDIQNTPESTVLTQERKQDPTTKPRSFA